jgi:hypothetical protein
MACYPEPYIGGRQNTSFFMWISVAVRTAQLLGFHKLGSFPCRIPEDPAWPPGPSGLKLEHAKRLWYLTISFDWMFASYTRTALVQPDQCKSCMQMSMVHVGLILFALVSVDSPLPLHCNEADLALYVDIPPRPMNMMTDTSFTEASRQLFSNLFA